MSVDLYFPVLIFIWVHSSWMCVSSALSTTCFTICGGMKYTPSLSPNTTSPGITVAPPMRTGTLMPVSMTLRIGVGCTPRQETRSEEHTSELQSLRHLVCRLLLGKKKE